MCGVVVRLVEEEFGDEGLMVWVVVKKIRVVLVGVFCCCEEMKLFVVVGLGLS